MKTLSKLNARDILIWYNTIGISNWGTWGNYPNIPTGATYHSFDNCHCRILLDESIKLDDGTVFNCISDSRIVPGKKVHNFIYFSDLEEYIKTDEQKKIDVENGLLNDWARAKAKQMEEIDYLNQSEADKLKINEILEELSNIIGTPNSKKKREELEVELRKYKRPIFIDDDHWMRQAMKFNTAEDYVSFIKNNKKQ